VKWLSGSQRQETHPIRLGTCNGQVNIGTAPTRTYLFVTAIKIMMITGPVDY
jgi:hypothetical protein